MSKWKPKTLDDVANQLNAALFSLDPIFEGRIETVPSSEGRTIGVQMRKTTMKDAKEICHHLKLRLIDLEDCIEAIAKAKDDTS